MMAGIRGKNTRPEMLVRQFLHDRGFRYRLHMKNLPGSPDIVLPKWRVAILVHGCFWHRHEGCRYATTPTSNVERWQTKFAENVARDRRNIADLITAGWRVLVLWECKIKASRDREIALTWLTESIKETNVKERVLEWPESSRKQATER
jgi:DNA mismatch endonuclease (patch repair protein)